MRFLSDEVRLFARMAIFGLAVGGAYWLLTYEEAGTVLLVAFGFASGLAAVALFVGSWRAARRSGGDGTGAGAPDHDHIELLPGPGWAPLIIAAGAGGLALGAAFGPWLTIAGLLIAIVGGWSWLSAAMHESDSAAGRERP